MRNTRNGHPSLVLWLVGLSGSGKSTLANLLESRFFETGFRTYVLDGDNVRHGLCSDLDFTVEGRMENLRRLAETAKLFHDAGHVTIVAAISPYRLARERARQKFPSDEFIEIYLECPLAICQSRDPKGIYRLAHEKKLNNVTGISAPFEAPESPEIIIRAGEILPESALEKVWSYLQLRKIVPPPTIS